jgi:hypothetical protein
VLTVPCVKEPRIEENYRQVTVKLFRFLTSVDAVGSTSSFDIFTPGERVYDTHLMGGWRGHATALGVTTQKSGCVSDLALPQSAACIATNRAVRSNSVTLWTTTVKQTYVGVEVLTGVLMKSFIIFCMTSCSPLEVNRQFGEICRLHHQGQKKTKQ